MRPAGASSRQSLLRETNLGLVVQAIFGSPVALSRSDVASATRLTKSTVSRLVDELLTAGVVDELERVASPRGRPATPLVPGHGIGALGLQVNAGGLAARVLDLRGRVVAEAVADEDLVGSDPATVLDHLSDLANRVIEQVAGRLRLVGAGLALPGIVSVGTGELLLAPNLGWSAIRPADILAPDRLSSLSLRIGNEADLAARTIATPAPGRPGPLRDFIYVSGEIGIGGATVLDGKVQSGRHGWAGEVGHVCVDPAGPGCRCGSTGCLEQYAGRRALLRAAGLDVHTSLAELVGRADRGDSRAQGAIARGAWALSIALASAVNLLDIPAIVLGGDLAAVAPHLQPELSRRLQPRIPTARWAAPVIELASHDATAGATGAALAQLQHVVDHPAQWAGSTQPSSGAALST